MLNDLSILEKRDLASVENCGTPLKPLRQHEIFTVLINAYAFYVELVELENSPFNGTLRSTGGAIIMAQTKDFDLLLYYSFLCFFRNSPAEIPGCSLWE